MLEVQMLSFKVIKSFILTHSNSAVSLGYHSLKYNNANKAKCTERMKHELELFPAPGHSREK